MSSAEPRLLGFRAVSSSRSPAYSPSSQTRVSTITPERAKSATESQARIRWRSASTSAHPARAPPIACASALIFRGPPGGIDPDHPQDQRESDGDGQQHLAGHADYPSGDEPGEAHRTHDRRGAVSLGDKADRRPSHQG